MAKAKIVTPTIPEQSSDIPPPATETGTTAPIPPPQVGSDPARDPGRLPVEMFPLVSAFDAGWLLNRLRFHLEQAWFAYGNHRRAARRFLGELGRAVRNLVPAAERGALQETVTRPFEELLDRTESEAHFVAHENRMGEFADGDLTDDDLRRD